jgi:hypothetical protein
MLGIVKVEPKTIRRFGQALRKFAGWEGGLAPASLISIHRLHRLHRL